MNVIKYNVNSGDVCQIGRQYEYGKTQVVFEGYQVIDSANEIYFKFVGRTEDSKYLIPIVDMTLDITQQLTKHVGQFSCQLEEMNTEGTLVSQSPVFYVSIKRSIKVGADYEVQEPRLETIYQKYNEMYNIISQTNETSLANESQRQAEWLTLKQEVSDAIDSFNADIAIGEFRTLVQTETDNFNTNAENKVAEFDTHTEQIQTDISELKSKLEGVENLDDVAKTIRISDFAHGDMRSGSLVASNSFAYSSKLLPLSIGNIYFDDTKYQLIFLRCDENGDVIGYSSSKTTSPAEVVWSYNKLQLYEKNNQSITLSDANASTYYVEAKSTKIVEAINSLCNDTYETKVEDVNLTEDLTNICYADNGGVGSTISENGSAETQYKAIIVPVKSGDSFKITGTGGSAYRLWCFTNTSRKILSVADAWASATNSTITASANGYLYYQISTAYNYSITQLAASVKYIRAEEDFKYLQTMTGFGMFQSIAGIGDSYTEGDMVKADGTWVTKEGINYLSAIGKRNGITVKNYGSGGATTETYQSRQSFTDAITDTASDLYIFALGQNDINVAMTKGTIADIHEDYTENPDTFYGNYGKIISQIMNHAPKARFIIMGSWIKGTSSTSGLDYQSYNDALKEIAEHYKFPYIDPFDDDFFDSKLYNNNMSSGHPTAMGYIGMSYAMERLFSKCVQENALYFKYALLD